MFNIIKETFDFNGTTIELETGRVARQADGAVWIKAGGTVVMVAVVGSNEYDKELDYFPLTVNYNEKAFAAGKIPGGFIKRETKPGDKEVLVSRLIDRPMRPLFPEDYRAEVQVTATCLSTDQVNTPDILSIIATSAAINISDIPFKKVVSAVRIGRVDGKFIVNPSFEQLKASDLDIIMAGHRDGVCMVEGEANEVSEKDILEAMKLGYESILQLVGFQEKFIAKLSPKKRSYEPWGINKDLKSKIESQFKSELSQIIRIHDKKDRNKVYGTFLDKVIKSYKPEDFGISGTELSIHAKNVVEEMESVEVRTLIREKKERIDGRKLDEIRPIHVEVGVLPRVHGSAIFTRGQTQSLGTVTLGTADDVQRFDNIEGEYTTNFMLHYNFPPFSVGECGRSGSPGRREIGHGNLALRSLKPVIPNDPSFLYTIRIVSDILESNGSSSMATVCSGCLAMLQAGVPIKASVAGIAMGLIKEENGFFVLSDIAGAEDHFGDMDFKVAGTRNGINGLQMDIKIDGLTFEIMEKALDQAKKGRFHILDKMDAVISKPNPEISELAPRIITMQIDKEKIRDVIGSGGSVIRELTEKTGTDINIDDTGLIQVAGKDLATVQNAIKMISAIVEEPEIGKIYDGHVVRIMEFGIIVEFLSKKSGMVHKSRMPREMAYNLERHFKIGDPVKVRINHIEFDRGKQKTDLALVMEDQNPSKPGNQLN